MSDAKHSELPLEVDSEDFEGAFGRERFYKLLDVNGKVICDTFNSEVAEVQTEDDGEGAVHRWDEQGRLDMELICHAVNSHYSLTAQNEELRRQLEAIKSDCRLTLDQYEKNGPQWTQAGSGNEYYSASFVMDKMHELIAQADAALTPEGAQQ